MDNKDIATLRRILRLKKNGHLADLLEGVSSDLDVSSQYGSRAFSQLTTFLIFAPIQKYYNLIKLGKRDKNLLLKCIQDIYPVQDNSPEIISVEFRLQQTPITDINEEIIEDESVFKFFISYSHIDKKIAGKLKEYLEEFGLKAFLAHEDIEPSEEWQLAIIRELKACDAFLPILTRNFPLSNWTGQESGIAYIREKLIIPLKFGLDPFGFMGKFQALNLDDENLEFVRLQIIDVLSRKGEKDKLVNSLIEGFGKSLSFTDANGKVAPLKKLKDSLNFDQIKEIVKVSFFNSQIYNEGYLAGPFVRELILNNNQKIHEIFNTIKEEYLRKHHVIDNEDNRSYFKHKFESNFKVKLNL